MDVICVIAVIAQRKLLAYVFTCCLVYLFSCSRCSSFSTVLLVAAITYFLKLGHNNHVLHIYYSDPRPPTGRRNNGPSTVSSINGPSTGRMIDWPNMGHNGPHYGP